MVEVGGFDTPLALFVRGVPGSGKTVLTAKLVTELCLCASLRLDPDTLSEEDTEFTAFLTSQGGRSGGRREQIYRYQVRKAADALRKGRSVIWEQAWRSCAGLRTTLENLAYFLTDSFAFAEAPFQAVVVEIELGLEEAQQRLAERGDGRVSPEALLQFARTFESCSDLGVPLLVVDGRKSPQELAAEVVAFLDDYLPGETPEDGV